MRRSPLSSHVEEKFRGSAYFHRHCSPICKCGTAKNSLLRAFSLALRWPRFTSNPSTKRKRIESLAAVKPRISCIISLLPVSFRRALFFSLFSFFSFYLAFLSPPPSSSTFFFVLPRYFLRPTAFSRGRYRAYRISPRNNRTVSSHLLKVSFDENIQ